MRQPPVLLVTCRRRRAQPTWFDRYQGSELDAFAVRAPAAARRQNQRCSAPS
jgi:hypothetical protein